jgi:hypothetical protein
MPDFDGDYTEFPNSLRWNAEAGTLSVSAYDLEAGERVLKEIPLGPRATFVMDLLTRARGWGLIRVGTFDMRLSPVSAPLPPRPDDEGFKPAIGVTLWNPEFGETRLEATATLLCRAIRGLWDHCLRKPEAARGLQPVIRFVGRVEREVKSVGETFLIPKFEVPGWVERDKVPGWKERAPTVSPPAPTPILPAASVATFPAPATPAKEPVEASTRSRYHKAKRPGTKPDDPPPFDDEIPLGL